MKKVLFAVLASAALLAAVPAMALASHHRHHRSHHRSRTHHRSVRHERWGSDDGQPGVPAENQTAGTVMSFTGGILTIRLNDQSTVSGAVTSATELECEAAEPQMMSSHDRGRDGGDGSQSGDSGDNGSGSDDGNEPGDQGQMCTTAALTPNTVVSEAELRVSSTGASWEKVELVTP